MRSAAPYYAIVGVIGVVFVVWLFTSMARTEEANRVLITLVACFLLVGAAGALSALGGRDEEHRER